MGNRIWIGVHRASALACGTLLGVVVITSESAAQTASDWQRGTVLVGSVGGAAASSQNRLFAGTALGWEIMPRLRVEGRAAWVPQADGPTDFVALLNTAVPLRPGHRSVPFLSGGIGMYRATIDYAQSDIPAFYARRLVGGTARPVFEDLLVAFGGGADLFATSHLAVRPELSVFVVMADGDRRWMAVYAVNLAYHFEAHGIRNGIRR